MDSRLKFLVVGLVPGLAFLIDRATKSLARGLLVTSGTDLQTGIIDTVVHENRGIIANIPVPIPAIIAMTVLIVAVIAVAWALALKHRRAEEAIALGLIIGGAVSNLADRILHGFVYDWVLVFGRSAINAADVVIVMGAVLYAVEIGKRAGRSQARASVNADIETME